VDFSSKNAKISGEEEKYLKMMSYVDNEIISTVYYNLKKISSFKSILL